MDDSYYVEKFLSFLEVERRDPDLPFLNELTKSHQLKVRWENLSKIVDYEKGYATEQFLPPMDVYIDRIVEQGGGGTCWTLAVGFRWLLERLGYEVHYLYMDHGHLCLRVELDQPYYVDVGYTAPLFKAYPLLQSFTVTNDREVFAYEVQQDKIEVTRTPGPFKTLSTKPTSLESLRSVFLESNHWETGKMLKDLLVFGYIDGVPTSLTTNTLKQFLPDQVVTSTLTDQEVVDVIKAFKIDRNLYLQAKEIFQRRQSQKQD
ncbi:arylamine N-acetyltransferase [Cytobacillus suaedae]|nr:arylamine N-acetyltransferase [Cytobacillus suaedae]